GLGVRGGGGWAGGGGGVFGRVRLGGWVRCGVWGAGGAWRTGGWAGCWWAVLVYPVAGAVPPVGGPGGVYRPVAPEACGPEWAGREGPKVGCGGWVPGGTGRGVPKGGCAPPVGGGTPPVEGAVVGVCVGLPEVPASDGDPGGAVGKGGAWPRTVSRSRSSSCRAWSGPGRCSTSRSSSAAMRARMGALS